MIAAGLFFGLTSNFAKAQEIDLSLFPQFSQTNSTSTSTDSSATSTPEESPDSTTEPPSDIETTPSPAADDPETSSSTPEIPAPLPEVQPATQPEPSIEDPATTVETPEPVQPAPRERRTQVRRESATTTPIANSTSGDEGGSTPFTRTTDGGSNQYIPANYYPPLDSLSPEATYTLSGIALLFGILGATFILREPERNPRRAWIPNIGAQELLEP